MLVCLCLSCILPIAKSYVYTVSVMLDSVCFLPSRPTQHHNDEPPSHKIVCKGPLVAKLATLLSHVCGVIEHNESKVKIELRQDLLYLRP